MSYFQKEVLEDIGYNTIALPRTEVKPLTLLSRKGSVVQSLDMEVGALFEADAMPLMKPTSEVADITQSDMFEFSADAGLNFLSAIFKYFKLDDSKLEAAVNANKSANVSCKFESVIEEKVSLGDLDNFLTGAIPLENKFRTYMEKLKNSELLVITSVLRSSKFSIAANSSGGGGLSLDAAVAKMGEGNTKIDRKNSDEMVISHEGEDSLAFAFKAVKIIYDQKSWWEFWSSKEAGFKIESEEGIVLRDVGGESISVEVLPTLDELVNI